MAKMVVIADDLTGAADCVASSASLGCDAVVLLHSPDDPTSKAPWPETDILSIDANTRCLPVERAAASITHLVHLCDSHDVGRPQYVLYKKIDSTLRGNVAGEIAALLHARRSLDASTTKPSILVAPALPAQGRATVGGRLLVYGVPLEETDIWHTEACRAQSDIPQLLAPAGLSCGVISLETVRSDVTRLRQAILQSAQQNDVVVCDAEADSDLRAIAQASVAHSAIAALVGSAGLASHIPQAIGISQHERCREWKFPAGATLFVIGTAASASRRQAQVLEEDPDVTTFHLTPALLHDSSGIHAQIMATLQAGGDVLLVLDGDKRCSEYEVPFLSHALSTLVSSCAQFLGGLVATGGETARVALDALGIDRLHLLSEVEAGLPFSVADSWLRPLPVITKAGAFGSPQALVLCREFLRKLKRVPGSEHAGRSLRDHES